MSESAGKAVFLSYASQDAEAVLRICVALRAAGIEVWFDQNELVGGDQWDQKIRGQIKACTLFVPVISAATQARREGYFRIEWKLAAQRTHAFADGTPFLLPVVLDATKDGEALVPEEFRAVQWTRLRLAYGGQAPDDATGAFCARVKGLLDGETIDVGPVNRAPSQRPGPQPKPAASHPWLKSIVPLAGIAVGLVYVFRPLPWRERPEKPQAATVATMAVAREWPRNPELKRVIALIDSLEATMEDFRLAEEIATRALEKAPADPEIVTVVARVHSAFVVRNFDFRPERAMLAKRYSERAVQLSPDEPEALYALSVYLTDRAGDAARGETLARRTCELAPDVPRFWRQWARAVIVQRADEGLSLAEQNVARFPRDVLAHYELSIAYRNRRQWVEFERELDAALALAPLANAINWKARAALLRGDLAEMRQWLDRVPARARTEERTVTSSVIYALLTGEHPFGLSALQGFGEPWFFDAFNYSGPTALLRAQLLASQGKSGLARVEYEAALAELKRRAAQNPTDFSGRAAEIWTLLGLGRQEEARALHHTALEALRRPLRVTGLASWWFDVIPRALLIGDRETALALIREAATEAEGRRTIKLRMQWDVRMAPFRGDPEIVALLAEPAAATENNTVAVPASLSEAAQLAGRALLLFTKTGFTRDDLGPAEDFARRATDKEPDNAAAWGVRAGVQSAWIFRNWDVSEKRRQDTQALANRALALDPNEPEALLALSHVLRAQGAFDQAAAHLRRAMAAHPNHVRLARSLGFTLLVARRDDEARTVLRELAQRAPRDPLVRYELAMSYTDYSSRDGARAEILNAAIEQLDAALAIQPFASALLLKATLTGGWRGDLPGMRATLDRLDALPLAERSEDRSVCLSMWAGLIERRPDRVEAAAALTARTYFEDNVMPLRPKAWSLALAHQLAGKANLARQEWQAAEAVLRQRVKDDPANTFYQVELAITLAWLDQREEAARLVATVEPVWREDARRGRGQLLARYYGAVGDAAKAVSYLAASIDQTVFMSRKAIALDPWWDKVRGAPEFAAALNVPTAK